MGNSFVYVRDDNIVKVHIHVIEPYKVLAYASRFGEFNRVNIDNMTLQFMMHNKNTSLEELEKTYNDNNKITSQTKIVVTVPSENLKKVYENEFGITNCLNCEKIGNPTIQQFYDLIKSAKSKNVILITDNSNTLLAAEQAIKLFPKQMYNIKLLPCKDIAASYLTCLSFNPELDNHDVVFKEMNKVFKSISTAKISKSIKNIKYKNLNIKFGDTIGVYNKEIIVNSRNDNIVSKTLINHLFSHCKAKNTVVIIYGKDATMQQVDNMVKYISQTYLIKPIIVPGNQPTYQYYIGTAR
jgi:dihydroxyacetone kinase-like predicted kinase